MKPINILIFCIQRTLFDLIDILAAIDAITVDPKGLR